MNLDFIIIGAQKAATTFVQRGLVDHPEVSIPDIELDFLIHNRERDNVLAITESLFNGLERRKLNGIKGADYLGHPEIADDVCRIFPDVKLIAILRDPFSRAFSAYHHLIRYGFFPVLPPEEGMAKIYSGEWDDAYPLAKQVRDYGKYGRHLRAWIAAAGRERVLILRQESLLKAPAKGLAQVYEFLGVRCDHQSQSLNKRSQAVTYHLGRLRWLSIGGRFRRLFEKRRENGILDAGAWEPLVRLVWIGITAIDRLFLARLFGNQKQEVSEALKSQIGDYYAEDQRDLAELLGQSGEEA